MTDAAPATEAAEASSSPRADRAATWTFAALVLVAVPVIFWMNRAQWFFLDEWDFLAGRDLRDPQGLLEPHNEHWTTLPILWYRVVFRFVGLHHYWPYQVPVVAAHVASVALIWVVLRRAGAHPWVATGVGGLLLFLGSGRTDLGWAFQITFTGALALGLAHLVLADHDGPAAPRRDALGIACGVLALMFSGVGAAFVVVVGLAVLLRRGWRAAALHAGVPAGVYAAWYLAFGRSATAPPAPSPSEAASFVRWTVRDALAGAAQYRLAALAVAALVVGGAVIVARAQRGAEGRARYAAVVGLAVGGAVFLVIAARGRASSFQLGPGLTADRYVHLVVVLWAPLLAVGATALVTRWRWTWGLLAVLLVAALPGNVRALEPTGPDRLLLGSPPTFAALAQAAADDRGPSTLEPDPFTFGGVTTGWLRGADRAGHLPDIRVTDPALLDTARLRLSLQPVDADHGTDCRPVPTGPIALSAGQALLGTDGVLTVLASFDGRPAVAVGYLTPVGLRVVRPVTVVIPAPAAGGAAPQQCRRVG